MSVKKLYVTGGSIIPQADFNQTDETKTDFIKNKPTVDNIYSPESTNAQSGKAVAGAISTLSNTLKGSASGEIISLKDVSPSEHNLQIVVSGENIDNITKKQIQVCGFNLWDEETEIGSINTTTGVNEDTITNVLRSKNCIRVIPSTRYYIKCPNTTQVGGMVQIYRYDKDMNYLGYGSTGTQNAEIVSNANWAYIRFVLRSDYGTQYNNDICLNISDAGRNGDYEPYEGSSHSVNEDGSVDGVRSIYPMTTLFGDTVGTVVSVEYNRDLNKAFEEIYNAIISLGGNI